MKVINNFFWFIWELFHHKWDETLKVPKNIKENRLATCKNCPLINKKGLLVWLKGERCSVCGCFLAYKTIFSFEVCPDQPPKWGEYKTK